MAWAAVRLSIEMERWEGRAKSRRHSRSAADDRAVPIISAYAANAWDVGGGRLAWYPRPMGWLVYVQAALLGVILLRQILRPLGEKRRMARAERIVGRILRESRASDTRHRASAGTHGAPPS